jgi:hypothetical protein
VLVGGVVTAAHVPTGHAEPQVYPAATDALAVLAAVGRRLYVLDRVQVGTGVFVGHDAPFAYIVS